MRAVFEFIGVDKLAADQLSRSTLIAGSTGSKWMTVRCASSGGNGNMRPGSGRSSSQLAHQGRMARTQSIFSNCLSLVSIIATSRLSDFLTTLSCSRLYSSLLPLLDCFNTLLFGFLVLGNLSSRPIYPLDRLNCTTPPDRDTPVSRG